MHCWGTYYNPVFIQAMIITLFPFLNYFNIVYNFNNRLQADFSYSCAYQAPPGGKAECDQTIPEKNPMKTEHQPSVRNRRRKRPKESEDGRAWTTPRLGNSSWVAYQPITHRPDPTQPC